MRDDRTLLPTTGPTLGGRVDEPAFWKGTANPTPGQTHRGASHEPPPNHSHRGPSRRHDRAAHSATQRRHVVTPGTDGICYGLNRDTSIKQGQIAHIDQDSSNAAEENLVFLCMPCHDKYDSTTRQSKNFTAAEIRRFREELDQALTSAFSRQVAFGEVLSRPKESSVSHYIRVGGGDSSAELTIHTLPSGDVRVVGEALWGTNREYGPNIGTLDFLATPEDGVVRYEDSLLGNDRPYRAVLRFVENGLVFEEEGFNGYFGMNVTFAGDYAKAT